MDTDDLSKEAYNAVILEAEKFDHNLCLHFGLLADGCKSEQEYLGACRKLIDEIRSMSPGKLSDLFFGEEFNEKALFQALDRIMDNLNVVKSIPEDKRHFDF